VSKRLKGKSYREAANAIESKREKPEEKQITNRTPGLVMEVVITSKQSSPSSDAVSSATKEVDSDESVSSKPKRRAAKRVMVISDDEDSVVETAIEDDKTRSSKKSKPPKTVPRKGRLVKHSSPSSDYEGSSAEEEDSDVEMASNISDDEDIDIPKSKASKGKAKAIPKPKLTAKAATKGKASSSKSEESDATGVDDMDMDLDGPATKKTTKRKAGNDNERPAKKAKRADSDPWKLSSKSVQREWTEMQAPPFEIFHFSRKVVDEYTYLDGKIHSLVTSLTAERQWVLSGTPPIHDFGALKTIAAFLDAHLGDDDDGEGTSAEVKKRRREQTGE
jgi:hypothetical protein